MGPNLQFGTDWSNSLKKYFNGKLFCAVVTIIMFMFSHRILCTANQLTGFYIRATLTFNGLRLTWFNLTIFKVNFWSDFEIKLSKHCIWFRRSLPFLCSKSIVSSILVTQQVAVTVELVGEFGTQSTYTILLDNLAVVSYLFAFHQS